MSSDPQAYISSLSVAIGATAKPKRNVLRLHFSYLASHFWATAEVSTQELLFHQVIFPFLLFSKPRQKTAELVWEIIGKDVSQSLGTSFTDWLAGCAALAEGAPENGDSVDSMNHINLSISEKIAGAFSLYCDGEILIYSFVHRKYSLVRSIPRSLRYFSLEID